jgi:hypothetical protein
LIITDLPVSVLVRVSYTAYYTNFPGKRDF